VTDASFIVADADATRELGARFARACNAVRLNDDALLVVLTGELGAGKTTFVSGVLRALGHAGPVRSPTYTLIEPYELSGRAVVHGDLYRLRHPDELEDIGLRDLLQPGSMVFVEWPERAEGRLGTPDLALDFHYVTSGGREVVLRPQTATGQSVLAHI
jgi:tRNA threonylcarbamoyladenosine biosynthesis protein TsaE